jgi:hypothetical protein
MENLLCALCVLNFLRRLFGQLVKRVSVRDWNNEHFCKDLIGFANDFYVYNGHNVFR